MLKVLCNNKDIVNDTMKPFGINAEKEVLVGKINEILFACDNYCPHKDAILSKGKLKPIENRIVCYMHYFEYNLFTGKLEKIPDKWKKQSTGWKKSGDLKIYKTFEDNHGNVFVDIPE
jgi:nitrite reductase/ring-hydroxylating ferredoxin subunit